MKNTEEQKETDIIDLTKMKSHYALSKLACESYLINNSNLKNLTILRFGIIYSNRIDSEGQH